MIRHFERHRPHHNMARFYRLEVRPTLFGEWCLVRVWGRIGTHGRERFESFCSRAEALTAVDQLEQAKRRRGYVPLAEQLYLPFDEPR